MRKFICLVVILTITFAFAGCEKAENFESNGISTSTSDIYEESSDTAVSEASEAAVSSQTESTVSSNTSAVNTTSKANVPCTHDYRKEIVGVSCSTDGYLKYTCAKCGHSYNGETVPAGHDFGKYLCERCGKVDPDSNVFWGVNAFLSKYGKPNGKGNMNCYPDESANLKISNYLDQNNFFIEYQDDSAGEIFKLWVKEGVSTVSFRVGSTYGEYEIKNSDLSSAEKIVFDDFSTNPDNPVDMDVFATVCAPKIDKYLRMAQNQILIPKMGLRLSDFGFQNYS